MSVHVVNLISAFSFMQKLECVKGFCAY